MVAERETCTVEIEGVRRELPLFEVAPGPLGLVGTPSPPSVGVPVG